MESNNNKIRKYSMDHTDLCICTDDISVGNGIISFSE